MARRISMRRVAGLNAGTTRAGIQKDVDAVVNLNISPALQQMFHTSGADLEKAGRFRLRHIHLPVPGYDFFSHKDMAGDNRT